MLLFLALTAWVVYRGVEKGIEKFSRFIMPGLILLILGIAIFSLTLSYTCLLYTSDSALEKMLYLASENVVKKWTQRYRNWDQVLNQLIVLYGERLTAYL